MINRWTYLYYFLMLLTLLIGTVISVHDPAWTAVQLNYSNPRPYYLNFPNSIIQNNLNKNLLERNK